MATVGCAAPFHRLMKGQMLEGVQRIVMNENTDRSLRRQEVRRMLDDVGQPVRRIGAIVGFVFNRRWRVGMLRGGMGPF